MSEDKGSFWTTMPGILTGVASVIGAVTGLVIALNGGDPDRPDVVQQQSAMVAQASQLAAGSVASPSASMAGQTNITSRSIHEPVTQSDQSPAPAPAPKQISPQEPRVATAAAQRPVSPEQAVDCNSKIILNNSVGSLMSWSRHYFDEAQAHQGSASQRYDCEKLLQYRASAWCKDQSPKIRNALAESLKLCRVNSPLVAWYKAK